MVCCTQNLDLTNIYNHVVIDFQEYYDLISSLSLLTSVVMENLDSGSMSVEISLGKNLHMNSHIC